MLLNTISRLLRRERLHKDMGRIDGGCEMGKGNDRAWSSYWYTGKTDCSARPDVELALELPHTDRRHDCKEDSMGYRLGGKRTSVAVLCWWCIVLCIFT
jgi:hypothetical protein